MRRLSLVPTPIGNLADITLRALDTLRACDAIAAEDTRHSRKLLDHHGVRRPLLRLDAFEIRRRGIAPLEPYEHVAYVTDAGSPGISDPGAELVALALEAGVEVEALPGATAFVPALVLSGLPVARFTFEGFLPRKGGERRRRLAGIAASAATSVVYESPNRLAATLRELAEACGPGRRASVSRELSKRFEETRRGDLAALAEHYAAGTVKGEIVVVIAPADPVEAGSDWAERARELADQGLRGRDLRKALETFGAPRNLAYELALEADEPGSG